MGLIPEQIIHDVIDRTDIVEIISASVSLKPNGRSFKANCPFHHEKTPSFIVNPDKQIFHCFGCGVGGNVISFVMKHDRYDFPEAVRWLAGKANVEIPETASHQSQETSQNREDIFRLNQIATDTYHQNLLTANTQDAQTARDILKQRGVNLETVKIFKIGYALDGWDHLIKKLLDQDANRENIKRSGLVVERKSGDGFYDRFRNRIIFPVIDSSGRTRAFGARAIGEAEQAKYINSPETAVYIKGDHLYGLDVSRKFVLDEDRLILVEGYMDCIIPFQAGVKNIAASLGTALTTSQIKMIKRFTQNVTILYDSDSAGEAATQRAVYDFVELGLNVSVASLEEGFDPDSYIGKYGVEKLRERLNEALDAFDYLYRSLTKKHDVNTAEGKAAVSKSMLKLIQLFSSEVLRAAYLEKLSGYLSIPLYALKQDFLTLSNSARNRPDSEKKNSAVPVFEAKSYRAVEKEILRVALKEFEYVEKLKESLDIDCFQDSRIKTIFRQLYNLDPAGTDIKPGQLIEGLDSREAQLLVSELSIEDESLEQVDKIFKDCVYRIKHDHRRLKQKELVEQIHQAEINGKQNDLLHLIEQLNQLIKE